MNTLFNHLSRLTYLAFFLTLNIGNAQQTAIPPSPTAASLGVYADVQVGLYTGRPDIKIPLWEIDENGVKIPIALNYLPGGIKVEEISSWIGLGWSLQAGGVITRSILGNPDDNTLSEPHYQNWWNLEWPGWLDNEVFTPRSITGRIPNLVELLNSPEVTSREDYPYNLHDFAVKNPTFDFALDGQPDVFYYNFMGRTGIFYFNKDQKIVPQNRTPFQFAYSRDSYGNLISFQITDDKGNDYFFQDIEKTRLEHLSYSLGYNPLLGYYNDATPIDKSFNSSWYLSKVKTPSGQEILFAYDLEQQIYNTRTSQYYDPKITNDEHIYGTYSAKSTITARRLSAIETQNTLIKFVPGNTRQDLLGDGKSLQEIRIFDKLKSTVTPIRTFKLTHDYFQSPGTDNARATDFKRLWLKSVQEVGEGNSASKPPFSFNYHYRPEQGIFLPERLSFEQDLWGYYNANGSTASLIPKIHIYPQLIADPYRVYEKKNYTGTHYVLEGNYFVNRMPNEQTLKNCVLSRITYPTGGYRAFEYEPHRFLYDGSEEIGGGLRIKTITNYDDTGKQLLQKEFEYKLENSQLTSGLAVQIPTFAYKQNNYSPDDFSGYYSFDYYRASTIVHNIPLSLGSTQGSNIGYKRVKETDLGDIYTSRGYTVYRFAAPGMHEDLHDRVNVPTNPPHNTTPPCSILSSGFCDALFTRPSTRYRENWLNARRGDFTGLGTIRTYPFAPALNYDWNRGQLLSETKYNSLDQEVHKTEYEYSIYTGLNGAEYIRCLKMGVTDNYNTFNYDDTGTDKLVYTYSFYDVITNVSKLPIRKKETFYSDRYLFNGAMTTIEEYDYNANHFIKEKRVQQNDGSWLKTEYRYANDIDTYNGPQPTNPVTRAILSMSRPVGNILSNPIEIIDYRDNKVIAATVETYIGFPSGSENIRPYYRYTLDLTSSITDYSKTTLNSTSNPGAALTFDTRTKIKVYYDSYDDHGNITQLHKAEDINTSYIWSYNNTLPVIVAENIDLNTLSGIVQSIQPNLQSFLVNNIGGITTANQKTAWQTFNTSLRNHSSLQNAKISTYTYKPLIGITSETDLNGRTTYYEYDSLGRLSLVRDHDGNIVKQYTYQFKTQ